MFRQALLILFSILLVACKKHDEHYFRTNPQALQSAVQNCQKSELYQLNCSELEALASEMNSLIYDLQLNPQNFGIKILKLQTEISKKQQLGQDIKSLQQQLTLRLAIVKWLESPES